jgi:hypothetical protein
VRNEEEGEGGEEEGADEEEEEDVDAEEEEEEEASALSFPHSSVYFAACAPGGFDFAERRRPLNSPLRNRGMMPDSMSFAVAPVAAVPMLCDLPEPVCP